MNNNNITQNCKAFCALCGHGVYNMEKHLQTDEHKRNLKRDPWGHEEQINTEGEVMKIGAISDDETTISQHFGRAPLYVVVTVEAGKIVSKETRAKTGHHTFAARHPTVVSHPNHTFIPHRHPDLVSGERHGYDAGSQVRHQSMAETISDCQVLLAGGMGWGAYENLKSRNIEPMVTDVESIDEAVKLYLDGKLTNLMERLH
ncbi:hypothetical protein ES705_22458 [subsurface metagenome]